MAYGDTTAVARNPAKIRHPSCQGHKHNPMSKPVVCELVLVAVLLFALGELLPAALLCFKTAWHGLHNSISKSKLLMELKTHELKGSLLEAYRLS